MLRLITIIVVRCVKSVLLSFTACYRFYNYTNQKNRFLKEHMNSYVEKAFHAALK